MLQAWPLDGRPRLIHLFPWDLTVGGAQRMLDLWCSHEAHRWDAHILTHGARGPFAFTGATVHSEVDRSQIPHLIETLQPDLLVHHEPSDKNGIDSTCPQVWIYHCTNSLRKLPPKHAKPAMVFSNFDSDEINPAWRQLPLKVLRPQIETIEFRPAQKKHIGLVCGIVGRLHEDKVPKSFIEVLRAWQPGPWRIRFIGHGFETGYQRYVREKLANLPWVEFSDDVPPERMPSALRELDAVMITTDAAQGETGSYAALEAMATGLPVIARNLSGLRYNCADVALYANTDSELLAALRTLDDEQTRSTAGSKARQFVVDHDTHSHATTHSASFSAALRCKVAILMPVFDTAAEYLSECWDSIREQTFREWELVIVDDGSRNVETIAQIDRIAGDPRVVLIRFDENHGISDALNVGLSRCRADLVARMDADDTMLPTRLQRQVAYMDAHPDVTVLGTQMQELANPPVLSPRHPEQVTGEYIENQRNTSSIWFLNHPTVMMRRREVMNLGGYPEYRVAQDLGLWLKVLRAGLKIHNLPSVELNYRRHADQVTKANDVRLEEYAQIVEECYSSSSL